LIYAATALAAASLAASACRSAHVEVAVDNRTGAEVRLLEVDYPSASFGADQLAAGATMHYRIQLQGEGPIKVQYLTPGKTQAQSTGPSVSEGEDGRLEIVLLPAGKAEFHPALQTRK
jgi:hypothetical protein